MTPTPSSAFVIPSSPVTSGLTPEPTPSQPFEREDVLVGLDERSLDKTLSGTGPSPVFVEPSALERANALAAVVAPASSVASETRLSDHDSKSGARIVSASDRAERIESEPPPRILVAETPAVPPVTLREAVHAPVPDLAKTVMGPFSGTAPTMKGTADTSLSPRPTSVEVDVGSVPPVTSTPNAGATSELDERFFAEGERASDPRLHAHARELLHDEEPHDPRASQKMTVAVRARRARFAKYVQFAVAFCAVVCVMALVRLVVARVRAPEAEARAEVAQIAHAAAAVAQPPVQAEPSPAPAALAPADKPAEPAPSSAPQATPGAAAAPAPAAAAAPSPDTAAAPEPTGKTALQEKNDARKALERGKLADAIEAGERSIALDPTDADAYLLTGAAYLEKGKHADARRIFQACVKEAKKGPRGECGAMLR
jgi:hypothetical protein